MSGQIEIIARQQTEMNSMDALISQLKLENKQQQNDLLDIKQTLATTSKALEDQRRMLEEEVQSGQSEARELQRQIAALQAVVTRQNEQQHSLSSGYGAASPGDDQVGSSAGGLSRGSQDLALRASNASEQHSGVCEDEEMQMAILTAMVRDLKIKLAQATQEKVEALMRIAMSDQKSEAHFQEVREGHQSRATKSIVPPTAGRQWDAVLSTSPIASASSTFLAFMSARLGMHSQHPLAGDGASSGGNSAPTTALPHASLSEKGKSHSADATLPSSGSEQTVS